MHAEPHKNNWRLSLKGASFLLCRSYLDRNHRAGGAAQYVWT